ncbi:hypothetical protein AB1207_09435 [Kineococcus endophyticus]|uniref:Uncharacterized protein n=1 Tax=Kineococcus endophyticus TaxID=1181883 RepID=A0ABV3P5S6_9ACTN
MRYRITPSRPAAVLGAFVGAGMLVFGITSFRDGGSRPFLVFWCLLVVAIVVFNLWSAFSSKGSSASLERTEDDDVPRRR